jgi:hypothetical protein
MTNQPNLLTIEEQPAKEQRKVIKTIDTVRIEQVNREQTWVAYVDVESSSLKTTQPEPYGS